MVSPADWKTSVLPVLETAYSLLGSPSGFADASQVDTQALNVALGRTPHDMTTALVLNQLVEAGYIKTVHENDLSPGPMVFEFRAKALEMLAGWPSSSAEAAAEKLIAVLDALIANEPDEERKGRLQRIRESFASAGRDLTIGVASAMITPGGPLLGG